MELSELSPFPLSVEWEGQEITLKPFDLRSMTWAERFFCLEDQGGFERMNEILKNKHGEAAFQNAVVEIIFYLADGQFSKVKIFKEKNEISVKRTWEERLFSKPWKPLLKEKVIPTDKPYLVENGYITTAKILKEEIRTHENKLKIFSNYMDALKKTFEISFPQKKEEIEQTGGAIFQMLKAREEKNKQETKINWVQVYTKFFVSGGMLIDEFYSLTLRQVFPILEEIGFLGAEDFRDNAIANGIPAKRIKIPKRRENIVAFEKQHEELKKNNGIN